MSLRKSAISGVKWTTVEKIGSAVFQLLQVAILTRFLPKEAFGLIAMAQVIIGFSNIFVDMGLSSAILHKQDATQKEYSSIYWLNIIISIFIYLIIIIVTPLAASFYSELELLNIIPLLGLNLLFNAIGIQHRTILRKEFRFKSIALIVIISSLIGIIVAVVLAYNEAGVYSLVYSTLAGSLTANGLFLLGNLRSNPISLHFNIRETIPFLQVGGYQAGSRMLGFISKEIDIFIIGKMLGAEALGVYSLSKQIVLKVYNLVNPIIVNVLSPLLSSIQKEAKKLKDIFLKVIRYLAFFNIPIYLAIILSSKEILNVLYGDTYEEGWIVLSYLCLYYCVNSISNPVGSLQIATGRTDIGFYWTVLRIIITPPIIYLASMYSIEVVAITLGLLSVVLLIPMWYMQIKPMAGISLLEFLSQFYKPITIFLLIKILYMIFHDMLHFQFYDIINIILKTIIFITMYLILFLIVDNKGIKELYYFIKKGLLSK